MQLMTGRVSVARKKNTHAVSRAQPMTWLIDINPQSRVHTDFMDGVPSDAPRFWVAQQRAAPNRNSSRALPRIAQATQRAH